MTEESTPSCLQCDGASFRVRELFQRGKYKMFRCARCGLVFAWPRPSDSELSNFYDSLSYYEGGYTIHGYPSYVELKGQIVQIARRHLDHLKKIKPQGKILDFGCAYGFFVHEALDAGYDAFGVDHSSVAIDYAKSNISSGRFSMISSLDIKTSSFDIITLWDVIEHVTEPRAMLCMFAKWLKPNGVLALSTPNGSNWTAQLDPKNYREFKPPEHLNVYTLDTLRTLLVECGFRVISYGYQYPIEHRVITSPWAKKIRAYFDLNESYGSRWIWQNRRAALLPFWLGIYSFNMLNNLINRFTMPVRTHKVLEVYAQNI